MLLSVDILLSLVLILIAYQDLKDREISVSLFIGMTVLFLGRNWLLSDQIMMTGYLLINLMLLSVFFILPAIIYTAKNKLGFKGLKEAIGAGDWLFFGVIALALHPFVFVGYFILINLSTLIYLLVRPQMKSALPLAGIGALGMCVLVLASLFNLVFIHPLYMIQF